MGTPFQKGNTAAKNIDFLRRTENRCVLHPQGLRRCAQCKEIRSILDFNSKGRNDICIRLNSKCKICDRARQAAYRDRMRNEPELYCKRMVAQLKSRAKEIGVPFSITADELFSQWTLQDGKCYYTGDNMDFAAHTENRKNPARTFPSIDRKTPCLGYVSGNLVWTTWAINRMKNDLTDLQFFDFCQKVAYKK